MHPLFAVVALALAAAPARAQSTCPDGKLPGSVNATPVCCPGGFGATQTGSAQGDFVVICTANCGHPILTVCASTVSGSVLSSTISGSGTAPPSASASTTGTGTGTSSTLPSGCSTTVEYASTTGVCTEVNWNDPDYLSKVYGTKAGSATFGASPSPTSNAGAARITDAPGRVALAGALVGLVLL